MGMDLFQSTMEFPDCSVSLTLRDTCGQEQYKSLASQYYRETQGALVVYDITKFVHSHITINTINSVVVILLNICKIG